MLDSQFSIFSLEATVPTKVDIRSNALLLKACNIYIFSENKIYSEIDEMAYDSLNSNDFGCGALDIEFIFTNGVTQEAYPDFYTKCFVIRTNTDFRIKPMKINNSKCISKLTQNGDLVIGIRYYFHDRKEIEQIQNCSSFLVEGFIALQKPHNVFGLMCQLYKNDTLWKLTNAYTYKPKYAKNIKGLID